MLWRVARPSPLVRLFSQGPRRSKKACNCAVAFVPVGYEAIFANCLLYSYGRDALKYPNFLVELEIAELKARKRPTKRARVHQLSVQPSLSNRQACCT